MEKGISYPEKAVLTNAKEHDRGHCLHVLAQIDTKSKRKVLQTSHYLKAALGKSAPIWVRIISPIS